MMKKSIPTSGVLSVLAATVILLLATACGNSHTSAGTGFAENSAVESKASLIATDGKTVIPPRVISALLDAIEKDDRNAFASVVSYPLARPYPLRDVDDSAKMVIYYPVLVDDSLQNVIKKAKAEQWNSNGWRGWTLDDGQYLWIDEKLYAVNYVSKAERAMLRTLITEEINSLQPELRNGWHPAFCLHGTETGTIFRIDTRDSVHSDEKEGPYRLAIYAKGSNLHGRPSMSMRGVMDVDGSAGMRTYVFSGHDGSRAYYDYDRLSDDAPNEIIIITATGDSTVHPVERAYWRDYLEGARHRKSATDVPAAAHQ